MAPDGRGVVLHDRRRIDRVVSVVRVAGEDVNVGETFETPDQVFVVGQAVHRVGDLQRTVESEDGAVEPDHDGRVLADQREVLFQPVEFDLGEVVAERPVARRTDGGAVVDVDVVVQGDVVDLAQVERIVGRSEVLLVGGFGLEIAGIVGVVVVVARQVVERAGILASASVLR